MRSIQLFWLAAAFAASSGLSAAFGEEARVRFDDHQVVRVQIDTYADLETIWAISDDMWSEGYGVGVMLDFRIEPDRLGDLEESGLSYTVLIENLQDLIDKEQQALAETHRGWYDTYHPNDEIVNRMNLLAAAFPDFITLEQIGTSWQERPIWAMTITSPVGDADEKPGLCFNATAHAREWVTTPTVMYIAEHLVSQYDTDPLITALMDRLTFYIIPMMNPDGYIHSWNVNRMWRKTRRDNGDGSFGVDWNRNFSVGWGGPGSSGFTGSDVYRGTAPFSEPETVALRDFILERPNIVAHIDFHSFSQLILRPYGYDYLDPPQPDLDGLQGLGEEMAEAIFNTHGKIYVPDGSYTLYLAGGISIDWAYDVAGIYSWCFELRDTGQYGFLLPADQIIPTAEENLAAVLTLAEHYALPLRFRFPETLPALIEPGETTPITVRIQEISGEYQTGTGMIYSRVSGGSWTAAPLTPLGGDLFEATLPATACGITLEFYFEAQATSGEFVTAPLDAPAGVFQAEAFPVEIVIYDDFTDDLGWIVGAPDDDATTGHWERVNPVGTWAGGKQAQPDAPFTGPYCYVTGQHTPGQGAGYNDVDHGKTTLFSPVLELADFTETTISYWRWYSNHAGANPYNDVFVVDISNDGGQNWVNVETIGPSGPQVEGGWYFHEFRVADLVTPTDQVQVRFVASDYDPQALVEAAVDAFLVQAILDCGDCPEDLNGDGVVDHADLAILLAAWGSMPGDPNWNPVADINGDGEVSHADLAMLLAAWGKECP